MPARNTPQPGHRVFRVLVLGTGQLSIALAATKPNNVEMVVVGRETLDVGDPSVVRRSPVFRGVDAVINTAAFTAVDAAQDSAKQDEVHRVNVGAPEYIARRCASRGLPLIHVSTDYVFGAPVAGRADTAADGVVGRPLRPEDPPCPSSMYGATKLLGEQLLAAACPQASVVRTAWLYTGRALGQRHAGDFVCTMLRLAEQGVCPAVVDDQWGSPTFAPDLARWLWRLTGIKIVSRHRAVGNAFSVGDAAAIYRSATCPAAGVLHAAGEKPASWYLLAREVFAAAGYDPDRVCATTTANYPRPAPRPAWSVLATSRDVVDVPVAGFTDRVRTAVTKTCPRPATLW
ncbi:sugar nucleotide-binding protein [Corynebacterium sp. CCM 8862]|uniref:dTDP-4-dehydrorhamnose reductase n=1 Tax=Corynebacterium mendelii TaxID=2765362 RepID=A0A939E055_9CORY|nr:sugar nucleotide-binding protein [Corynebacterium mendelii]MBN9644484.1 sugar nucleotide-binding protein [Corynebacterium mendelii]